MFFMRKTTALPSAAEALPGRDTPIPTATTHFVNGRKLQPPYPAGFEQAVFGLGCFWAPSAILAARRGHLCDCRRLRRRPHQESNLRRGLLGSHRPYRSGAGGV